MDGGYVANNPTLLALIDATVARGVSRGDIRILSVGTGSYPEKYPGNVLFQALPRINSVDLIQMQFDANSNVISRIFELTSKDIARVRVNEAFNRPDLGTSLFESDPKKLETIRGLGRASFGRFELEISNLLV